MAYPEAKVVATRSQSIEIETRSFPSWWSLTLRSEFLRPQPDARIRKNSDYCSLLDFDARQLLAGLHGLVIFKHAGGFSIRDGDKKLIENPYAERDRSSTDFTSRDIEDYLSVLSKKPT